VVVTAGGRADRRDFTVAVHESGAVHEAADLECSRHVRKGLIAPFGPCARHFRPGPINRRQQTCPTGPVRAKGGHDRGSRKWRRTGCGNSLPAMAIVETSRSQTRMNVAQSFRL